MRRTRLVWLLPITISLVAARAASQARVDGWTIELVSVSYLGNGAGAITEYVSGDGRIVGFLSMSAKLVPNDTNGLSDVFVRDLAAHTTERVSVSSAGVEGDGGSFVLGLSADGREVLMTSYSSNFDVRDPDAIADGFIRDRTLGTTTLVTPRFVPGKQKKDVWVNGLSRDGRYVVMFTDSEDLLAGDTNGFNDVYVFDRLTQTYQLVSTSKSGTIGNWHSVDATISPDGGSVGFLSLTNNLVPGLGHTEAEPLFYLKHLDSGDIQFVHVNPDGSPILGSAGGPLQISTGGRFVTYQSHGVGLPPISGPKGAESVFMRDSHRSLSRNVGLTLVGNRANHVVERSALSADARFIVMVTAASNMTPTHGLQTDLLLRDDELGIVSMLNLGDHGQLPNAGVGGCVVSDDGRTVAFHTNAWNLVPEDASPNFDTYVVTRPFAEPAHYCSTVPTPTGCTIRIDSDSLDGPDRPSGPQLCVRNAPANSRALLFYGLRGPDMLPFGTSGWLCVRAPYAKVLLQPSGTSAPCGGEFDFDFAGWIDSGEDPELQPGKNVYLQAWVSDPAHASHGTLTDALAFRVKL